MTATAKITVLHSLAPPDGTTRYVDQMVEGAPEDVRIAFFSWRTALLGRYDVLHVHWPEFLVRDLTRRRRVMRRLALRATLVRARLTRTPIVRTVHNLDPHEAGSRTEARLLRSVDRATATFIRLNDATPLPEGVHAVTILHGHYRDRFAAHPLRERVPGRVLYFGIIRPRKNVELLIDVFTARPRPGCHLRIVGSPTPELAESIMARVKGRDDVSARLAFVDDDELVAEVSAASLVVLPYAEMHNSGTALVALSMNRPVLVPRSSANTTLAAEAGASWVRQFDGVLDDDDLTAAIDASAHLDPADRPRLEGRDWDEVGRRHRDVYREAIARVRGGHR